LCCGRTEIPGYANCWMTHSKFYRQSSIKTLVLPHAQNFVEYEKGVESPWFHWLNALPRYFSNAVSMTPFCCRCLPLLMASLAM
jgi:hypothetical protein